MKLRELTNLYIEAKARLEEENPPKKQKAVEGIGLGAELIRDSAIISFLSAAMFTLIAIVPPPLHASYDVTQPPRFVKPDWYLLWSLGPIFVAKWPIVLFGKTIVDTKFLGTLLVQVPFIAITTIPFLAGRFKAKRPVDSPANFAWGIFGLALIFWLSVVGIADVIFAYEVNYYLGRLHWAFESGFLPDPSKLIDILALLTVHQSLLVAFLAYWLIKRHRPRYESKLNATYYKVR
jgi:quinol-cytochrome oxidoreductase complex cytochrome b subunit